jgi:hypothetical protein
MKTVNVSMEGVQQLGKDLRDIIAMLVVLRIHRLLLAHPSATIRGV